MADKSATRNARSVLTVRYTSSASMLVASMPKNLCSQVRLFRLIDKTMDRFEIMFFAFRALLVPIIFILSIAIILFRNNIVIYFWLLVIVVEVVDLIYRRIRRRSHEEDRLPDEADA